MTDTLKPAELDLPDVLPGHWETAEGLDKAREYAAKTRADLALSNRTDLGLANALYLVSGEIVIQTAAKERMRWLSVHLALAEARALSAEAQRDRMREALELARGRITMLMPADLPGSDHPGATQYVLSKVEAALSQGPGEEEG
jgi:hypothetical protein